MFGNWRNGIVGRAICKSMMNEWDVISISRTPNKTIENKWREYICDVSKEDEFENASNIERNYGQVEVLINCACIRPMKKVSKTYLK